MSQPQDGPPSGYTDPGVIVDKLPVKVRQPSDADREAIDQQLAAPALDTSWMDELPSE